MGQDEGGTTDEFGWHVEARSNASNQGGLAGTECPDQREYFSTRERRADDLSKAFGLGAGGED